MWLWLPKNLNILHFFEGSKEIISKISMSVPTYLDSAAILSICQCLFMWLQYKHSLWCKEKGRALALIPAPI